MKQKLKEAQLAEKRERREQKQQQREDKAMSRKQEKENRQMQKEQQKKDAQKQKEQARENFRQIREQEAEERNLRNQLVQNVEKEERPVRPPKKELSRKEEKSEKVQEVPDLLPMSWTASYIPLKQVKNGIIQTSDNRFVKIVEVLPINFLLRSSSEQRSIILSFMSYLKIAPPNIQLKVLSRKADIQEYIDKIDEEAEKETDERCKILQEDYAELIKSLGMKEAITRRFFLIFEYPSRSGSKNPDERDVHLYMRSAVQTAKKYLAMCGNIVLEHENETRFCVEILYQLLNRQTCLTESLNDRIKEVRKYYTEENGPESIRYIPVTELVAPRTIDFRNWNYVVVDGLYYTYLYVQKYRSRVPAGWLSLLINAGEGIDIDVFFFKQDKNRCVERIGRRIRLNRSKIKDTYDSNSDFDSLSESIQAGYYLKRGLSGSEEFYYILLLALILTLLGMLLAGMKEEKRQFTVLLPLGDLAYDEDFLQKAKKIKGIKEIWPVIEVPVVIKIEDYTETTTFSGIDMNAFGKNPTQNELGKLPLLLLGNGSLRDMKDYNNHAISKKQQEKFLEMGENLNIFYFLDEKEKDTSKATDDLTTLSGNSAREPQTSYMPCKAAVVIEGNEIYIPISQAQDLCREIGEPSEISKVYLKINGKNNLENAKKILSGI